MYDDRYKMITGVEVDTGFPISELLVDGGMTVNNLLLQLQANFINEPVSMVILQWCIMKSFRVR